MWRCVYFDFRTARALPEWPIGVCMQYACGTPGLLEHVMAVGFQLEASSQQLEK